MRKRSAAVGAAAAVVAACTAVPAAAATPARASGTPMCATSQLSVAQQGGDAGAGNLYFYLVFTNRSGATCHVTGYPGVSMLDADGKPIGAPATRDHPGYSPVVLAPGASASDTIHTVNQQGTCLPASAQLRVYPPGNTASVLVPARITECYDTFSVTPLAAGREGNPSNVQSAPTGTPTAAGAPAPTPTLAPATGGRQVTAVPEGAPDTGLAGSASGGHGAAAVAAGVAAGVLAAGGLGAAAVRRRRSQVRG
ncbi:DUF4232 domain-containing protein [Actinacidiphila sp. ITFR-21]|uniref:DUF4232 domain-containing protein n=1 Tax=Actinacidiphila sp. ITFR-21 TaxID=3075199 RepID=UPI00288B332C|nr:DUF4232 domain-containing protein [Streptomyces sp. ITFR-21]WNI14130.1 DUF4232 domain-containing protein [Streptomyces sp. ITFR-21]